MKLIVTGVAGFIGSMLAEKLVDKGFDVLGIDCFIDYYPREIKENNLKALRKKPNFSFLEQNIAEINFEQALGGIEAIFHQAAQAGVRASWGKTFDIYTLNNILATQKLLEALKGSDIKLIYASSSSVYGETQKLPMCEGDIPRPISPYGVTKLAGEHLCRLYWVNHKVKTLSLRYFTVFGPRQRPDMAFYRFIDAIFKDKTIEIYGDGNQTRDFTYVSDVVEANLLALENGKWGEVYNIGGGTRTTVKNVIAILESIIGRKAQVNFLPRQKGDVSHTFASTEKASKEIGFKPLVTLEQGLQQQVEWLDSVLA